MVGHSHHALTELMIVNNLNLFRTEISPPKANSILVIDSNTVLTLAIAPQGLQTVARRRPQIRQFGRSVHQIHFASGDRP